MQIFFINQYTSKHQPEQLKSFLLELVFRVINRVKY